MRRLVSKALTKIRNGLSLLFRADLVHVRNYRFARGLKGILEAFGSDRLSKPYGVDGMEKHDLLLRHVTGERGMYVEIGGCDGYFHSPTYYLERFRGWRGVLIESIADLSSQCQRERPESVVYNCACVPDDYESQEVGIVDEGHSSRIAREASPSQDGHVFVQAQTMTAVLDDFFSSHEARPIDLLVLDVEGTELDVLHGLDMTKYAPLKILAECASEDALGGMQTFLDSWSYRLVCQVSEQDHLFELTR